MFDCRVISECLLGITPNTGYEYCCNPQWLAVRGVAAYRTYIPAEVSLLFFRACAMYCAISVGGLTQKIKKGVEKNGIGMIE